MTRLVSRRDFLTRLSAGLAASAVFPTFTRFASLTAQTNGHLNVAMPALPDTLDPHMPLDDMGRLVARQVFDTLVIEGENGEILPSLAESWTEDEMGITLQLREGVTFQNGEVFDGMAVLSNFGRAMMIGTDADVNAIMDSGGLNIDLLEPYVIRITSATPNPYLLHWLTKVFMVAPGHTEENRDDLTYEAVGTGAFQIVEFRPERYLDLEAFPDYWGETSDAIQTVRLSAVDDPTRLVGLIQRGEADILAGTPMELLASIGRLYPLVIAPPHSTIAAHFHSDTAPELADERVLTALNLALDRRVMGDIAFGTYADPAAQIALPPQPDYDPALVASVYDAATARQLLDEAGIETLNLNIAARSDAEIKTAALLLAFWEGIGLTGLVVEPDALEYPAAVSVETLTQTPLDESAVYLPLVHPQIVYVHAPRLTNVPIEADGTIPLWQVN